MEKGDIFTFEAPNGVEVTAVVIDLVATEFGLGMTTFRWLCYAQNRLFTYEEHKDRWNNDAITYNFGKIIIDCLSLPEFDEILQRYSEIEIAHAETQLGI